jgi:quinol monooxygenase YgiN
MFAISGRRRELVELLERFERDAAAQPGCRRYTFAVTLLDPERFVLVSEWDDAAALEAHCRSTAFETFQFDLYGLLAQPSAMTVYPAEGSLRPMDIAPMDPRDAD